MHVLVIVLLVILSRLNPPLQAALTPPGISVVYDNGGAPQATVQPTQTQGPPTPAVAPPPAAPPPPQAAEAPEVNLDMPDMTLAPLPEAAEAPPAQAAPAHMARQTRVHHAPSPKYTMMNGMSYNKPAPFTPGAKPGLNLSPPMTDTQAVLAPQFTIKGNVGPDFDAEMEKWGSDHIYYPDSALEQHQQGAVTVEFKLDHKGHVTGLHIVESSGSVFLDQAWLGLFTQYPLPVVPPQDPNKTETIDYTAQFSLGP